MEVFIDEEVHKKLISFYQAALRHHEALDETTVVNKINRLYEALDSLGDSAEIFPIARLKEDWISKGYQFMMWFIVCHITKYTIFALSNGIKQYSYSL